MYLRASWSPTTSTCVRPVAERPDLDDNVREANQVLRLGKLYEAVKIGGAWHRNARGGLAVAHHHSATNGCAENQKDEHRGSPLNGNSHYLLVAGEGFEPPTRGL
jgi:hypothetical protein